MVENKIKQIIYSNLRDYLEVDDINYSFNNNQCKYTIHVKNNLVEINYNAMDSFYTLKLESGHNNIFSNKVFLTKSKKFKKNIKNLIQDSKLKHQSFHDHIFVVSLLIKKELEKNNSLIKFDELYNADLKFDGIFL